MVEVYKRDRRLLPRFRPHGAVPYDQRILSWKGIDRVSVLTLGGREVMPWVAGAYQHARLAFPRGQADLVFRDGAFYLFVTVDVGDVPPGDHPSGWLGIDLGIANVATDSDDLLRLMQQEIRRVPGVAEVDSFVGLRIAKGTFRYTDLGRNGEARP